MKKAKGEECGPEKKTTGIYYVISCPDYMIYFIMMSLHLL